MSQVSCATPAGQVANGTARRSFVPNVDIVEMGGDIELRVDLPGASPEQVSIQFEDGTLSIEASVTDRQPTGTKYLVREYGVGDFRRQFRVANTIDASRIDASLRNGVLVVRLPKAEEAKPRRIAVTA